MEKGFTIPVLDHGFVRYIDSMGSDERIVEAARISYKSPSKGKEQDKKLLAYLYKNRHCYHEDMEVLTVEGWKRWKECKEFETYLVPNPTTHKLQKEKLKLEAFNCNEQLYTYSNARMSYAVTHGHRMWFKSKNGDQNYKIYKVEDLPRWGHFEGLKDYRLVSDDVVFDPQYQLLGFYLGDGGLDRKQAFFHLKKERKIAYLENILKALKIDYSKKKSTWNITATMMKIDFPSFIVDSMNDFKAKTETKHFRMELLNNLTDAQILGLFDGLVNSDGSVKKDRHQIEFSSSSLALIQLFEVLGAMRGLDVHRCTPIHGITSTKAYFPLGRTSLESRKEYFNKTDYSGKVYCTTTSTGLLMVRGGPNKFAFVCGNTSPFEMVKITLNIKMPIFVMRQYVRHRMQNLNEVSARYTELPEEFYVPEKWRAQDTKNKQGSVSSNDFDEVKEPLMINNNPEGFFPQGTLHLSKNQLFTLATQNFSRAAYQLYQDYLAMGMAREMARMVLPVNIYTEIYACWDLKNLLHFITLREDAHAQAEIQEYGRAIKTILNEFFPYSMEAYEKYKWKLIEND